MPAILADVIVALATSHSAWEGAILWSGSQATLQVFITMPFTFLTPTIDQKMNSGAKIVFLPRHLSNLVPDSAHLHLGRVDGVEEKVAAD